jgi:hypothetical protein
MSYHEEQGRKFSEASRDGGAPLTSGIEWGLPLGIAGAVLVIGLIFYNVSHQATTTASNTGGTVQSTPQKAETATPPAKQ